MGIKIRLHITMRALIVAVVGGLLLLKPAYAHSEYQRSEPGEGAVVARSPHRVDIWFTQELFRRQGENQIQVFGETGQSVQAGDAQVDDDDRKHLWVSLQADLQPGRYRVVWRSLSAEDGDVDEGEFIFLLDPAAAVTSTPMGAGTPTTTTAATAALPALDDTPTVAPATRLASTAPADTQPGSRGSGCLPGLLPVMGFAGISMIHKGRRLRRS